MKCEDFICYTKKNKVLSVGMNLNNIIAKHYYSDSVFDSGGFRKNLNIPLPLMLLNHENSFLKEQILNTEQKGGSKNKKKNKKKNFCWKLAISTYVVNSFLKKKKKKK